MPPKPNPDLLTPRSRQQIAEHLGFSTRTLKRKMQGKGIVVPSGLISYEDQIIIYTALGYKEKLLDFSDHKPKK